MIALISTTKKLKKRNIVFNMRDKILKKSLSYNEDVLNK